MDKRNIYDLSFDELTAWVQDRGLKPFAVTQIVQWLYSKRVRDFEAMTNLSKTARALLVEEFIFEVPEVVDCYPSTDGTVKFAASLADSQLIEYVLMPQLGRITLCVSSQVGCGMGCTFCKTAEMKLTRNLSQGEILGQVMAAFDFCRSDDPMAVHLRKQAKCDQVTNVVYMGMGEPLQNLPAVIESILILIDDRTFNFGKKKITVSTVGLPEPIIAFAKAVPVKLAVSLNTAREDLRSEMMPINRRHNLKELIAACQEYARIQGHGVTFEYVVFRDLNDSLKDARDLVRLISRTPCKINLIPFNEYSGSTYRRPATESMVAFQDYLRDKGFQVNIRYSKGEDIMAACGQLAGTQG